MRSTREQWAKRVRRWVDSGLTAPEFAAEMGLNPRTLRYWKWRLGKEGREAASSSRRARRSQSKRQLRALPAPAQASFVEVTPPASTLASAARLSTDRIECYRAPQVGAGCGDQDRLHDGFGGDGRVMATGRFLAPRETVG